ncbi:MAG: hypothetical protein RRY21_03495 [Oscillospiraceae bacterium]
MKKFSALLSMLAFAAAVAALAFAAANYLSRRRELFGCDDEEMDDDMFDANLDFVDEAPEADLSVEAEGHMASVDNAAEPADALPQEH